MASKPSPGKKPAAPDKTADKNTGGPKGPRNTIARLKGHTPPAQDVPVDTSTAFPLSTALAREQAQKIKEQEALVIGKFIPNKGVFFGTWTPKDKNGKSLGKTFNLFAAPQDLQDTSRERMTMTFDNAIAAVSRLKNWQGYNGARFQNEKDLYKALANNTYKGEWFIPTLDMLIGLTPDNQKITGDSLFTHKEAGALKNSFNVASRGGGNAIWYWSCTENANITSEVYCGQVGSGSRSSSKKNYYSHSVRVVRLELQPPDFSP